MSQTTGRDRLAEAFANLGLGDSRKKLDALKKPVVPSPTPKIRSSGLKT